MNDHKGFDPTVPEQLWIDQVQWIDLRDGTHIDPPSRWSHLWGVIRGAGRPFRRGERRSPFMIMNVAVSVIDGSYIGSPGGIDNELFDWLRAAGIKAQRRVGGLVDGLTGVANIGLELKAAGDSVHRTPCWWGWSHRARKSFRPGDVISRNHEFRIEYPGLYPEGHVIKDMRAAKLAASHFAEMVG